MEDIELYFRIKDTECDVNEIQVQMDRLDLEKSKRLYELDELNKLYRDYLVKDSDKVLEEETKMIEVEKPKKLKKPNDKLSENNIEV